MNETTEMAKRTGCLFRPAGVLCITRTKCDRCGWNPEVEKKRKAEINAKRSNSV